MVIPQEVLKEFKERMYISHSSQDEYLSKILLASYKDIKSKCGDFDILKEPIGKELVIERSRYAYNDALEFFNDNFLSQINSFEIDNLPEEGDPNA